MPREFKNLQAQDMGKLGWLQDLTRGVMKLCGKGNAEKSQSNVVQQIVGIGQPTEDSLIKRAQVFLEDGDWDHAIEYAWNYKHRKLHEHNAIQKDCPVCGKQFFTYAVSQQGFLQQRMLSFRVLWMEMMVSLNQPRPILLHRFHRVFSVSSLMMDSFCIIDDDTIGTSDVRKTGCLIQRQPEIVLCAFGR